MDAESQEPKKLIIIIDDGLNTIDPEKLKVGEPIEIPEVAIPEGLIQYPLNRAERRRAKKGQFGRLC